MVTQAYVDVPLLLYHLCLFIYLYLCMYVMHFVYRRLVGIISGNGTQEIIENLR